MEQLDQEYRQIVGPPLSPEQRNKLPLAKNWEDPLQIIDRTRQPTTSLRNMLAGGSAFLVVGGPSSKQLDLSKLKQRGIWTMAVNNMAGSFWPNAFVCADPPSKFHHGIWLDPTVMKFVPLPKMSGRRSHLREKIGDEFVPLKRDGKQIVVPDCPNVWAFGRRSWLQPDDTFFTEQEAAWGNHDSGKTRTGLEKTVCTMFLALRVLYYIGVRKIFLVGCDFRMSPTANLNENYSFGEIRDSAAIKTNNDQYNIAGQWLKTMQDNGTFAKFGLEIFNCFQYSALRAFPYVPFDLAIQETLMGFPKEPFSLNGWYEKK